VIPPRRGVLLGRGAVLDWPAPEAIIARFRPGVGIYQDSGRTTPTAATSDPIGAWNGDASGSVVASQATAGRRLFYDATSRHAVALRGEVLTPWLETSGFTFDQRNGAVFLITRQLTHRVGSLGSLFFGNAILLGCSDQGGTVGAGKVFRLYNQEPSGFTYREASVTLPTGLSLVGINCSAGACELITNDVTDTLAALPAGTSSTHYLSGVPPNDYRTNQYLQEAVVYNRTLTATELAVIRRYAFAQGAVLDAPNRVLFDGDSISMGASAALRLGFSSRLERSFALRAQVYNLGLDGYTLASMVTDAATWVDVHYSGSKRNVCVIFAGTNDIALSGTSGADTFTLLQTYVNDRVAAGWKVVVVTRLPRAGTDTQRGIYNGSIRTAWGTPSATVRVADWGGDANMGANGTHTDLTYYDADAIHPNDTGHQVGLSYIQPEVEAFLV
jgi:lysophospholipase L1-like esterase